MDQPLVWSDSFAVGYKSLDDEHRHIIALINRCCVTRIPTPEEHLERFHALRETARAHIRHEDLVLLRLAALKADGGNSPGTLRDIADAAITDHIADHVRLMRQFDGIEKKMTANPPTPHAELCSEIMEWFLDHAIKQDAYIRTLFQSM